MFNILLVDDEMAECEGLKTLLKRKRYPLTIYMSKNGKDALETIEKHSNEFLFDIVITDIKMPFMDGITLAEKIKSININTFVILSSAYADFEFAQKAIGIKVDYYILKPIDFDVFNSIMTTIIELLHERESRVKQKHLLVDKFDELLFSDKKKVFEQVLFNNDTDLDYNEEKRDEDVIKRVISLITKHHHENIGLEWIANQIFLSSGYLSALFKKETGINVVQYITMYRMERAKDLLVNTNMKIVDISKNIGYSTSSYFGMQFKKHYGIAPHEMRETIGEK